MYFCVEINPIRINMTKFIKSSIVIVALMFTSLIFSQNNSNTFEFKNDTFQINEMNLNQEVANEAILLDTAQITRAVISEKIKTKYFNNKALIPFKKNKIMTKLGLLSGTA